MEMFIANITKQAHDFLYRRPESGHMVRLPIPAGSQTKISADKLEIDAIIDQHSRYGMINVREIKAGKPYSGLAYSIDKPVDIERIKSGIQHNDDAMEAIALEARKNAAVAVDSALTEIGRNGGAKIKNFEVEVEEVKKAGDNSEAFHQTVEVQREGRKMRRNK